MMSIRKLLGAVITATTAFTVSLGVAYAEEPLKIGFIYPSPAGDVGWAHELDRGRLAIEEAFGDKVESIVVENIPEGPDAARIMNQFAAQGAKMIMLGSFGYMNDGLKLARQHPDIKIIHASGYKLADNMGNFQTRNYESAYVAGMAAGYVTKSNTIGMVAAYAIPEVVGIINAFTLGAQLTNPDTTMKVVWLNSWFDPSKAQESARSLIAQDSDVIFSIYQDTPSVVTVAEEEGAYVVNTSSDMKAYAPEKLLVSMQISWADYFIEQTQAVLDGTFEGSAFWGGMGDNAISMASWSEDLTAEQLATLNAKVAEISDGSFHPFDGPVVDQDGKVMIADGETIADQDLLGINWLVDGVETRLPK
ncbi:MAG: BMP family ABC transporter substrate-binding protein [Granulosicoccus sp.]